MTKAEKERRAVAVMRMARRRQERAPTMREWEAAKAVHARAAWIAVGGFQ